MNEFVIGGLFVAIVVALVGMNVMKGLNEEMLSRNEKLLDIIDQYQERVDVSRSQTRRAIEHAEEAVSLAQKFKDQCGVGMEYER